jgi:hypothetical protein
LMSLIIFTRRLVNCLSDTSTNALSLDPDIELWWEFGGETFPYIFQFTFLYCDLHICLSKFPLSFSSALRTCFSNNVKIQQ